MNRRVTLFAFFLLIAAAFPAMATDRASAVAGEIIRMYQANVSDSVIYDYFAGGGPFTLTADDLIDLADAGISDRLIRDLLSLADRQQRVAPRVAPAYYPSSPGPYYGSYYPSYFYVGLGVGGHHHHYYPPFYHDHHYGYAYDYHGSNPFYYGGHSYLPHYDSVLPLHQVGHAVSHVLHDVGHAVGHGGGGGHSGSHSGGHGGGHGGHGGGHGGH